jgi:predicted transcriptional regulator YdeE
MPTFSHNAPLTIAGLPLRTTNTTAFEDIPQHWGAFFAQNVLAHIPNKISDELYAVYTGFDRTPQTADDIYSLGYTLVIGAAVSGTAQLPPSLVSTHIPAARRAVFAVEPAQPEQVGAQWQKIWQMQDLPRIFAPDYEHYAADGSIRIWVSVAA